MSKVSSAICSALVAIFSVVLSPYRGASAAEDAAPPSTTVEVAQPEQDDAGSYQTTVRGSHSEISATSLNPAGFTTQIDIDPDATSTDLGDLLIGVPGLRVRDTGVGGRKSLALRGAEAHQVAVYLDGVRITSPGRDQVDLSLLPPIHIGRVDVHRSASAVEHGSNAMGGAVVLHTPVLSSESDTRANVQYGPWQTIGVTAGHGGGARRWRYAVSGGYGQSDNDFVFVDHNGTVGRRRNNDYKRGQGLAKVDYVGAAHHVAFVNLLSLNDSGAPGPTQSPSATARQFHLRNLTNLTATFDQLATSDDRLTLTLYHRYGRFSFEEPVGPPEVRSANHNFGFGASTKYALPVAQWTTLTAGIDVREEIFRDPDTANPTRFEFDGWITNETVLFDRVVTLAPALRVATAQSFGTTVVPQAGLLVKPFFHGGLAALKHLALAANVGRTFRYPSFQELYVRIDGFGGNPDLKPEDAINADVGLRWRYRGMGAEVVLYKRWINNTILFTPVSATQVRPDNFSDAIAQGIESKLSVKPGLCFDTSVAYTYTDTAFGTPEAALPGHPPHRLTARVAWGRRHCAKKNLLKGSWLAGFTAWSEVIVDSRMVLARFNSIPEEGRVLLAAGAGYTFKQFTLSAEGRNLLDKRDAVDTVGFPLPPARFLVALAAKF